MSPDDQFLKESYAEHQGKFMPWVDVKVGSSNKMLKAIVDTGCSVGFILGKKESLECELGEPISSEPAKIHVADGHLVAADIYVVQIEIGGERQTITLYAVDPERIVGQADAGIIPLVGHGFLSSYVALFHGKNHEVQLSRP